MPGLMTIAVAQSGSQRVLGDAIGGEADSSRLKTQLVFLFPLPPGWLQWKARYEGRLKPRVDSIESRLDQKPRASSSCTESVAPEPLPKASA